MNRLQEKYIETVKPSLMKEYNYSSVMECPKLVKVVINMGVGDAIANAKALVSDDDRRFEEVVTQLEASRRALDRQNTELAQLKQQAKEESQ